MEELIIHSYQWEETTKELPIEKGEGKHLSIRSWCLNEDSNPVLIRIEDFPCFMFIELPQFVNNRIYNWSYSDARTVYDFLYNKLDEEYKPTGYKIMNVEKLYYYNRNKKTRVIRIFFNDSESMKKCEWSIKNPIHIEELGEIKLNVWDQDIKSVRKLLTSIGDFNICQWFKCKAEKVPEIEKISYLETEYYVKWQDIIPIQSDKVTNPIMMAFDLETFCERIKGFPDAINYGDCVYLNSCIVQRSCMPETRKKYIFIFGDCDDIDDAIVVRCKTEKELIDKFCDIIKETNTIVISGYNIYGFDFPYMDRRLKNNLESWSNSANLLKEGTTDIVNYTWASSAYGFNSINYLNTSGRICIDLLPMIKRDYKLVNYKLDTVSKYFLGKSKHDVKAEQMFIIYNELRKCNKMKNYIDSNPDKVSKKVKEEFEIRYKKAIHEETVVSKYCIQDSDLVMDLYDKLNIWLSLITMANTVDIAPMELITRGQGIRFISQLYNIATKHGFLMDKRNLEASEYTGAFVFPPKPGLYNNVMCLDFNSLYPSLIIAFNICFTTLVPREIWDKVSKDDCNILEWDEEPNSDDKDSEDTEDDADDDADDGGKGFFHINEDTGEREYVKNIDNVDKKVHYEFRFIKKEVKEGLLPKLVGYLISERKKVKKLMKKEKEGSLMYTILDKKQLALKVNANSIYGILGAQYGGMRSLIEAAKSITAMGRKCILKCNDYLEKEHNAKIVYNDTDSTMFIIPELDTYEKCWNRAEDLEDEISGLFPPPLRLEMEKIGRMLCIAKKKYVFWQSDKNGLLPEEKKSSIIYKGIILARRDNCIWLRNIYKEVMDGILNGKPMQETLDIIVEHCLNLYFGKVDPKELVIVQTLGARYKSATCALKIFSDLLSKQGNPVEPGDRLDYVVVKTDNDKDKKGFKMRLFELYQKNPEPIDVKYYLEHYVKNSIEQIWKIAYKDELKIIMENNENILYYNIIVELLKGNPYAEFIAKCYQEIGSYKKLFDHIEANFIQDKEMRKCYDNARKKYITGRSKINIFVNDEPIKLICEGIKKGKLPEVIEVLSNNIYEKYKNELHM